MTPARRMLLLLAGHLCVALGVIGAFLPVMPTTPFLLLAAACYMRSSERHHRWLLNHRLFGPVLRDYEEKRALTIRTKITSLSLLWASLAFSAWRVGRPSVMVGLLISGVLLSVMILRLKTLREERRQSSSGKPLPTGDDAHP